MLQLNFINFSGGPFVKYLPNEDRFLLIGILHGAFEECSNEQPTIYTRIDNFDILKFVQRIVFDEDITEYRGITQAASPFTEEYYKSKI